MPCFFGNPLSIAASFCILISSLFLCGCDKPTEALVQGTILLDGKPLVVEQDRRSRKGMAREGLVVVELVSMDSRGRLPVCERAIYDSQNGSFVVPGRRGQGIPPGEYKIVVHQLRNFAEPRSDLLRGKFSADRTPLRCLATLDKQNLVEIDLAEYLGTAAHGSMRPLPPTMHFAQSCSKVPAEI